MVKARKDRWPMMGRYVFKVHREEDKVMLEPLRETDVMDLTQGNEFITGFLKTKPWKGDVMAMDPDMIDGSRRRGPR
jgi:hypothetical protein